MKISPFVFLIFFTSLFSDVTDDSGNVFVNQNQRDLFWQRIIRFRSENDSVSQGGVVFLGNSIIEAYNLKKHFPGVTSYNRGITGDRIGIDRDGGVLKRLRESCFKLKPSKIFLMIGINDIGDRNRSATEIAGGYKLLVKTIYDSMPGVSLFVHSVLPTGGVYSRLNPSIDSLNLLLKELVDSLDAEKPIYYIDLHKIFTDTTGKIRRDLTIEGLHLKECAYDVWTSVIWDLVYSGQTISIQITLSEPDSLPSDTTGSSD
ncbi:hypothetical protein JW890_02570 [candidate division WOR-3 bacterium]|nr:hypothetical protein [candidate division WOR-3 bacterium]